MRNPDGTYSKVPVGQPENRGILLVDVLDHVFERFVKARPVGVGYRNRREEDGKLYRRFATHCEEKANALTTVRTDSMVAEPIRIGTFPRSDGVMIDHQQSRIYSVLGKSTNLNANGGGQGAKTGLYAVPAETNAAQAYEVRGGMVTIKDRQYPIKLIDGWYIIRNLTVSESMRLQTVPEWYDFSVISNTQAYKCLGNGWTCDVITHLINATQKVARRKWLDELLGDCL
jgi:DNA (cytosine-5)-methyltransferase 3A